MMFWKRWREAVRQRRVGAHKKACVEGQMLSLSIRYEWMTPSAIIDELYRMHEHSEMPIYYCTQGYDLALRLMLEYIGSHADCTAGDAQRLAQMLLWPEVKRFIGDNSCRLAILEICERFPARSMFAIMQEHFAYVREQLNGKPLGTLIPRGCGSADLFMEPIGGNEAHWRAKLEQEFFKTGGFVIVAAIQDAIDQ
jgi:hypothetical protein